MIVPNKLLIHTPMKRILLGLVLLVVCQSAEAQYRADDSENPLASKRLVVKANILSPLAGSINVHAEVKAGVNASHQIEYYMLTGFFFGEPIYARGFGLTYNYRFYLTGSFPKGFYTQPYLRYQQFWFDPTISASTNPSTQFGVSANPRLNLSVLGSGIVFGYQHILFERVSLEMFAGPMYNASYEGNKRTSPGSIPPFFSGGFIRFGITAGVLF
jgi:hypothetical protein